MKYFITIAVIFALALALRLVNLGDHPPGLTWDEAGLGYNAYSILKTGRDEHGVFLPLIFKSFGDYKPGIYVYLTVPAVAFFGLTEFAVRLPSAVFGAAATVGLYLFVSLLFGKRSLGLVAATVLAITPWHLHFSRGGWEVNVFSTILIFAAYLLLLSLKKQNVSPLFSLLLFALTIFTYQAAKLLSPLVFLVIVAANWPAARAKIGYILKREKLLLPIYLLILAAVGVYFYQTATGDAGNRVARLSIFGYRPRPSQGLIDIDNGDLFSVGLFHNQVDLTLRAIASRYLNHFSPELLFFENSTPREALPKMGLLYLFDAVWLLFGVVGLLRAKDHQPGLVITSLLLFAPLGASLTLSEFSVVRAFFLTIPLAIVIAVGMIYLFEKRRFLFFAVVVLYLHNVLSGLDLYFRHAKKFLAPSFNYGYQQAIEAIKTYPARRVIMTDVYGQPYIYYLFYTRYDPAKYQLNNKFISGGVDVGFVPSVENVEFHQFGTGDINTGKDTLFIGTIANIPDSFNYYQDNIEYYDQINLPDNLTPVFRVVKTKP